MITDRFNTLLKNLANHADKLQRGDVTDTEAALFHKEVSNILSSYQRGEITRAEYEALNRIFYLLQDATREAL